MLQLVDAENAREIQQKIIKGNSETICTIFCQMKFLDYHNLSENSEIVPEYLMGEIAGLQFIFPFSRQKINQDLTRIVSHEGSPYSGLCISTSDPEIIKSAYMDVLEWCNSNIQKLSGIEIRLPPNIIAETVNSHEWALWSLGFSIEAMYFGRFYDPRLELNYNRNRRRRLSKLDLGNFDLHISENPTDKAYEILVKNRAERHATRPIHSLKDFVLIEKKYPGSIQTFLMSHEEKSCATAIVFHDRNFSTLQYLAGSDCSFVCGSQDYLVDKILRQTQENGKVLLFGTSTLPDSNHREINAGLDTYKHSFGLLPYCASRFVIKN